MSQSGLPKALYVPKRLRSTVYCRGNLRGHYSKISPTIAGNLGSYTISDEAGCHQTLEPLDSPLTLLLG